MIDVSNGYHLYLEFYPIAGDSWFDHLGNAVPHIGVATIPTVAANPICVYDLALDVGVLSQGFENFPLNPLARIAELKCSVTSIWSSPDGSWSTPNFLWALDEIAAGFGSSFSLQGRTAILRVSTGKYPGLIWDGSQWVASDYSTAETIPGLIPPDAPEYSEVIFNGTIDSIDFDGNSRVSMSIVDQFPNKQIGTHVDDPGKDAGKMVPIVIGDFSSNPAPSVIVGRIDKVSDIYVDSKVPYSWTKFSIWLSGPGIYAQLDSLTSLRNLGSGWGVSLQDVNPVGSVVLAASLDAVSAWPQLSDADLDLLVPTPGEVLYRVDDEIIAIHSQRGDLISRGWMGTRKQAHAAGSHYYPVDSSTIHGLASIAFDLFPASISDMSPNESTTANEVDTVPQGDCAPMLANSRAWGSTIASPVLVKWDTVANNAVTKKFRLEMGMPSLGDLPAGSTLKSVNVYVVIDWDNGWASGHDTLTMICAFSVEHVAGSIEFYRVTGAAVPNGTYTTMISVPVTSPEQLASLTIKGWMQTYVASDHYPRFRLHAFGVQVKAEIPISPDTKLLSHMDGFDAVAGVRTPIAAVNQLSSLGGGWGRISDCSSVNVSGIVQEQIGIRDAARNILLQGMAVVCSKTGNVPISAAMGALGAPYTTEISSDMVIQSDRGQPEVTYKMADRSSVYSSVELRWGYDYSQDKWCHSLKISNGELSVDGLLSATLSTIGATSVDAARVLSSQALSWLGGSSAENKFRLDCDWIQEAGAAELLLITLVSWLCIPRISVTAKLDWSSTQDIDLLSPVYLAVTGLPARIWGGYIVIGCDIDIKIMVRSVVLVQAPASV